MTSREKRLTAIFLGLLFVVAILLGYVFLYLPWSQAVAKRKQLEDDLFSKTSQTNGLIKESREIRQLHERSLPLDQNIARREYDWLLTDLIRKAGIQQGFSITQQLLKDKDNQTIPILPESGGVVAAKGKEKYSYQKMTFEVKLSKVDIKMVSEFLRLYHEVQLLHHISNITISKKDDNTGSAATRRTRDRTNPDEWKDLEVVLTTEAMILDGVDNRRTIMSLPAATAGLVGYGMFNAVSKQPDMGRALALSQAGYVKTKAGKIEQNQIFENSNRNYASLIAKDLFHGPIPPEPPPPPPIVPPPPPPKIDISQFVKFNEISRRGDGTVSIQLRDVYNNYFYLGDITPKGERVTIEITKKELGPTGKPIYDYRYKPDLMIRDENKTATNATFRLVCIDGVDGLVLFGPSLKTGNSANMASSSTATDAGGNRGLGGRNRQTNSAPKQNPALAVFGGFSTLQPVISNQYLYLKVGQSLADMRILTVNEIKEIIRKNNEAGISPMLNPDVPLLLNEEEKTGL